MSRFANLNLNEANDLLSGTYSKNTSKSTNVAWKFRLNRDEVQEDKAEVGLGCRIKHLSNSASLNIANYCTR